MEHNRTEPKSDQEPVPQNTQAPTPNLEPVPGEPPKIYVASLADYNNGRLHGVWIDATESVESMRTRIADMLDYSREPTAEDFAVHDYKGFGMARIQEYQSLSEIHRLAVGVAEHGQAFAAWMDIAEGDDHAADKFNEAYLGEYYSLTAYGETIVDDMGWQRQVDDVLPESVARYTTVDAEALAQDMWLGGEILIAHKPDGGMWIFRAEI